jgi:SAM-dependent methyltransferase
MSSNDKLFAGSITKLYEAHLVPLIFDMYAADIVKRLASRPVTRVLEVAAGTGAVTRKLASTLPKQVEIVATDLNQAMLDQAAALPLDRPVTWRQADAMQLPFDDESFDAVVMQFGAMFFPDKPKAFSEAHRVLKPGGVYIFNVWDKITDNEFADIITNELAVRYPENPPRFLSRTPYAYFDRSAIAADLAKGGFTKKPDFATVTARSKAESAHTPALAYVQGTPLRAEVEAFGPSHLAEATDATAAAIAKRFGTGPVDAKIQAIVVTVEK